MAKDMKYGQSETPIMYPKNHLKLPSRKLWQKENLTPERNDWSEYRNEENDKWDEITAPKFVNFSNLPDIGDSFFNNVTVIVSTPKPASENSQLASSDHEEDENTLIASFGNVNLSEIQRVENNITLSEIKQKPRQEAYKACNSGNANGAREDTKNATDNDTSKETIKLEDSIKAKKPQSTTVHPFTFEMRDKQKQELKQERINKILEEEKKVRTFRAKPAPKFLKTEPLAINKHDRDNNNDNHSGNNNDKMDVANRDKVQGLDIHKKPRKHIEVWKRPAFVPCLSKENPVRPKTPPLQTTIRAQQRRQYDDSVREKQRQKEQAAQMEMANKKKREEEEIARLRKQTVHKAQPVPKYKLVLPVKQKRPLTDPITPQLLKRHRRV